jgi:hypothetical protein
MIFDVHRFEEEEKKKKERKKKSESSSLTHGAPHLGPELDPSLALELQINRYYVTDTYRLGHFILFQ